MKVRADDAAVTEPVIVQATTALVAFHVGKDETRLFWLEGASREPQVDRVPVTEAELAEAAGTLRGFFRPESINFRRPERTTDMKWLSSLGSRLLSPLADRLATPHSMVISAHGPLHGLPLHLLESPGGGPLGTMHAISYTPSLSLHGELLRRHGNETRTNSVPCLCLATCAREDPEPMREAFSIAPRSFAAATGGLIREGADAEISALRNSGPLGILYFSCHGLFSPADPLDSCLLLAHDQTLPSRIEPERRQGVSIREILERRISAPLVVLDACMSGIQHVAAGDEPIGFPTAFLLAGAEAVIATNWVVEQNRAREFMLTLLEYWSSGKTPLGIAMREAYNEIHKKFPHPFHWAAFSLFGNPELMFPKGASP